MKIHKKYFYICKHHKSLKLQQILYENIIDQVIESIYKLLHCQHLYKETLVLFCSRSLLLLKDFHLIKSEGVVMQELVLVCQQIFVFCSKIIHMFFQSIFNIATCFTNIYGRTMTSFKLRPCFLP